MTSFIMKYETFTLIDDTFFLKLYPPFSPQAFLHYFLLVTCLWQLAEGVHLYVNLAHALHVYNSRRFLLACMSTAWGNLPWFYIKFRYIVHLGGI